MISLLGFVGREKLPDEVLDPGDVSAHLQDRVVLLSVGKVKWVHDLWTHVFLSHNS